MPKPAAKRVTIIDLASKALTAHSYYARVIHAGFASIMPQVTAAWCEEMGHEVVYRCHTGFEDLETLIDRDTDVVFISAFSRAAQTAYAIANIYRMKGAITVLGGPHARAYPEDAVKNFDYVLGFTDKNILDHVMREMRPKTELGQWLSAPAQPAQLPELAARWKFIEPVLAQSPYLNAVPMIGSLGCPYTCSFCVDATVDYQPLPFDQLRDDLRFLLTKKRRPTVGWHDPNFGVRFNDYMDAIEDAVPRGRVRFLAESSLSLLSEPNLKRLKRNGFFALLPGIESWFDMGAKSKTGRNQGMEKVRQISDHINMVMRYVPFVQTNFVFGLDCDEGPEPFELTKRFMDLTPGAFPVVSVLNCFGRAAPLNLEFQRAGRVRPFPHFFVDGHRAMNVKPLNYEWIEFYERITDMTDYAFDRQRLTRRFLANRGLTRPVGYARGVFSRRRFGYHKRIIERLKTDKQMLPFFEGSTDKIPNFYTNQIRRALGPLWDALPKGALSHDPNAYLKDPAGYQVVKLFDQAGERILQGNAQWVERQTAKQKEPV